MIRRLLLLGLIMIPTAAFPLKESEPVWEQAKRLWCTEAEWTTCREADGCRASRQLQMRVWDVDFERGSVLHWTPSGALEDVKIVARNANCSGGHCSSAILLQNNLLMHLLYRPDIARIPPATPGIGMIPAPRRIEAVVYNHKWGLSRIAFECKVGQAR